MKKTLLSCAGGVAVSAGLACAPAQATEGYFTHGFGAVNKSMAGAGVATGFDAMSQATNPAALTLVDPQFTADISIFSPRRESTLSGTAFNNGTFESDRNYFYIPSLAGTYEINPSSSWGWAFYGQGGMNTTYDDPVGPFFFGKTGVDLAQAFLQFTYAREITPSISVGISPILAAQRFKAFGLQAFAPSSTDPANLTNRGYDMSYGYGGKIGVQADVGSGIRLGASYQSRMYMSEFDKYSGLFAEQGDFDIPPALQAGLSWSSGSGTTIAFDYKRIFYGEVDSVANSINNFGLGPPGFLGADNGAGFGWETINAYKLGIEVEATPTIKVRGGIGLNDNPIPAGEVLFNVLAPGVQEQHYTAGLTWQATPNSALLLGLMYSPTSSLTGTVPGFLGGGTVELEMWQFEATAGWTWSF
jgi:long-chain fatty acid transport protein